MNWNTLIDAPLGRLDELLVRDFGAPQGDFAAKAERVAEQLPDELGAALVELRRRLTLLRAETEPDFEHLADFAFRCGELHAGLTAYIQVQMELENVVVGSDRINPTPLAASEVEPLARLVEVRDRLFRKVADFTLKVLLIGLGLMILALVFGLI